MKSVHLLGARANFTRRLRVQDLDALGIPHKGEDLVWNKDNNFTVVMNNKASESLVEKLPLEFKAYDTDGEDEIPEVKEPMTSIASTASNDPQSSLFESEGEADDDVKSSTRKTARKA